MSRMIFAVPMIAAAMAAIETQTYSYYTDKDCKVEATKCSDSFLTFKKDVCKEVSCKDINGCKFELTGGASKCTPETKCSVSGSGFLGKVSTCPSQQTGASSTPAPTWGVYGT